MNAQASAAHLQPERIDSGPIKQCAGQMRPPGVFWRGGQGGGSWEGMGEGARKRVHERGKKFGK